VQVMMIVWEDVGRLKKGEYITVENIEDWARIQKKILEKKDARLRISDSEDSYYLIVTYTDKGKKEQSEKYKIKKVLPSGTDESSGTQPVEDGQERDSHSGTGSSWVSGND